MKGLGAGAALLFLLAIPCLLVSSNLRAIVTAPALYQYGFQKYNIGERTGLPDGELARVAADLIRYFGDDAEFLSTRVTNREGRTFSLYNERELIHMRDVKGIMRGFFLLQGLSLAYVAAYVVAAWLRWRADAWSHLARRALGSTALTFGVVGLLGLSLLAGLFDRVFLLFHAISFANDFWQLDPRRDYLIMMFPQGFFLDTTVLLVGAAAIELLVLGLVARWYLGRVAGREAGHVDAAH